MRREETLLKLRAKERWDRLTPRLIVIGGLLVVGSVIAVVVFLPLVVFKPTDTLNGRPYTKFELEGRRIFMANGCNYCHSQFTRPFPVDFGPNRQSDAGRFNYDNPHLLGTLRTGPDLSNIGFKRGDEWEILHLKDPRDLTPNSIMPSFSYLSDRQLRALVAYMNRLGDERAGTMETPIAEPYRTLENPIPVTVENWYRGRAIFVTHCMTCHGDSGSGNGPYAGTQSTRPADFRQPRFRFLPDSYFFWRMSEAVPGTVMPQWKRSLTATERWLVVTYIQHSFAEGLPHAPDEGDVPPEYRVKNPVQSVLDSLERGKSIYTVECTPCHGFSGAGDGPNAAGLEPAPPDFRDKEHYSQFTDGDWYWRISEGLLMRAMPQWKLQYSAEDRWHLVNYVRDMLSLPRQGREPDDSSTPARFERLKMPGNANADSGKLTFAARCALCHGDAGQGEGWAGGNLVPPPANFTDPDVREMSDGRWFWRLTVGVRNSAMPRWGLLLTEEERWDVIKYEKSTFVFPPKSRRILPSRVPDRFVGLDNPISDAPDYEVSYRLSAGKDLYDIYCAECHAADGRGGGPFAERLFPRPANLASGALKTAGDDYRFWKIYEGVAGTSMPPWKMILAEDEIWNVLNYEKSTFTP